MKMDEAGGLADDQREWKVEQPFSNGNPSCGVTWNERVAGPIQPSGNQETIKTHVSQKELREHFGRRTRPRLLKPAQKIGCRDQYYRDRIAPIHLRRKLWQTQKPSQQKRKSDRRHR